MSMCLVDLPRASLGTLPAALSLPAILPIAEHDRKSRKYSWQMSRKTHNNSHAETGTHP